MRKLFAKVSYYIRERKYLAVRNSSLKGMLEIARLKASIELGEITESVKFALQRLDEMKDECNKSILDLDSSFLNYAVTHAAYVKLLSKK